VFALEKDEGALKLIQENKRKFSAANLEIVAGSAPDALMSLPAPDKVFIGGSGGKLAAILDIVYQKNNNARVVINAITLETLCEAAQYYKDKQDYYFEVIQAAVAYTREIQSYHLITAQNPVFIIAAGRKGS
jgi:precorrin-6Y C5,15-methyltransferase (decarboxylating)